MTPPPPPPPGVSGFPVPVADADTAPFWAGCEERRLLVPRCRECGHWIWQPRPLCPRCHAAEPEWTEVTGGGTVASWTVIRPPVLPAYAELVPYVILLVELAEGVRMVGYLVADDGALLCTDGTEEGVAMAAPVALRWHTQDGLDLPSWTCRPT